MAGFDMPAAAEQERPVLAEQQQAELVLVAD
jgi:hypothetical protein